MKKSLALLVLASVLSMTACNNNNNDKQSSTSVQHLLQLLPQLQVVNHLHLLQVQVALAQVHKLLKQL